MMRESNGGGDQVVVPSSIAVALLQERFRQLQRVKEMREGRDKLLVRTTALSLTERCSPTPTTPHYDFHPSNSNSLIFRSETVTPRPPSTAPPAAARQVSLSLCPKNSDIFNSHAHQLWSFDMPKSYSYSSWPTTTVAAAATKPLAEALLPPIKFQDYSDSDVDTSLHL